MTLVTKQYLYETIASLLEGGSPSAGKKFEPRMIQAHLQQAINRKLKTEYLSVTLPGDETIPDGLVIACYDNIPVYPYKTVSRAKLPAMPQSLRKNMGVYFVGPAYNGNIIPVPPDNIGNYIIIESVTGGILQITGTTQPVTGLQAGSTSIQCSDFINKEIKIIRGSIFVSGINKGDGSTYFSHTPASDIIVLSNPIDPGEYIRIEAFPQQYFSQNLSQFISVECIVGNIPFISGLPSIVAGVNAGSVIVSSSAFVGKNVLVIRGSIPVPGINPGDGSGYFTKDQNTADIVFSQPLQQGEYLFIQTI